MCKVLIVKVVVKDGYSPTEVRREIVKTDSVKIAQVLDEMECR